jgi:hypothetical protein
MAWVMPEIAVQRLVQYGIYQLRQDKAAFDEIFSYQRSHPLLTESYGEDYTDKIWTWFTTERIRVVQAWILSPQTVPCFSVHLSNENEDESKAAIGDYYGDGEEAEIGIASMSVLVDIGIHGSKAADQVLWMYYILSYVLFKYKHVARSLGIDIQTYSASDWQKDASKMPENIWTRWLRMRCTVFNTWNADALKTATDIETSIQLENYINIDPDHT